MATLKLLLSQARRHYLTKTHSQLHSSPFIGFNRLLCSSESIPNPNSNSDESPKRPSQSVPLQTISYAVKPRDQTSPNENLPPPPPPPLPTQKNPQSPPQSPSSQGQETRTGWTREDIRYVKDVPSISPVSYPTRVAPLPEDRASVAAEGGEKEAEEAPKEENVKESEDMRRERRRIEVESLRRRVFRVAEEEKVVAPFPTLIKVEKKEQRPVLDLMEALKQVKANAKRNFDETLEAHVRLGIDKKRSELIVRGSMTLPHGAKKAVRVAFFAEGADADEARAAGADVVGGVDLIEEIANSGKIDFDKCFSTHQVMRRLFKISRILNHHGLMPNPKQGTVTSDVSRVVKEAKEGQVKFRMDKSSIVHVGLGKVSFKEESLRENVGAFMNALLQAKPAGLKKTSKYAGYVNSFHICSTMGPGFPVSIQSLSKAADHYNKVHLKA